MSVRDLPSPTPARAVVRLLWQAARRRAAGRSRRQQEILGHRLGRNTDGFATLARVVGVLLVCFVHFTLGRLGPRLSQGAGALESELQGRIAVPTMHWYLVGELTARQKTLDERRRELAARPQPKFEDRQGVIKAEQARDYALGQLVRRTQPSGRSQSAAAAQHRAAVERQFRERGAAGFAPQGDTYARQLEKAREGPKALIPVLALLLGCWLLMLVCQGEGLELDVQRRRHPMWEWLLTHPIRPPHAFYAELLAPLMVNPVYFTALIFPWVLLSPVFGVGLGFVLALGIGLPIAVATSGLNKAMETWALLRLGVRTRGAILGLVSWLGYVILFLPLLTFQSEALDRPLVQLGAWLSPCFPAWPVRALTFGWGDTANAAQIVGSWWAVAGALGALAFWVTHRATSHGLQAPTGGGGPVGVALLSSCSRLGRNPLQRKELLWLLRDKSAVVQVLLIPLTLAAFQIFNFRGIMSLTAMNWATLCGVAIICGTYFLLVLGPRSLASEGATLWLALTWPRGIEELLRAKARLWSRVASGVVGGILAIAAFLFPAAWWQIALVGGGWLVFSHMLALKAVSLVSVPSSSGEPEPPNRARHAIAMVGTLAFGTGVVTGAWHVAIIGIVFSSLVAVAMWQNLRARLPYLFDPWSERPVPAPSLLHAAVGIAVLVELTGVAMGIAGAAGGSSALWLARAIGYGLGGTLGVLFMQSFLSGRGVRLAEIVRWSGGAPRLSLPSGLALGAATGAGLALLATLYLMVLREVPAARAALDEAARHALNFEGQRHWFFLLAVGFAPAAEEYFFRGLLFRTLDRELGDWRAVALSAAGFAVFHPPLAWVPVAAVGLVTAWLFRQSRYLWPSVVCHMVYNATLLLWPTGGS